MFDKLINKYKSLSTNKLSILILVFWAFVSRGFGVLREALTGRLPASEADMLNSAAIINETIVTIFILGGLAIATLPVASALVNKDLSENQRQELSNEEIEKITERNNEHVNIFFSYVALIISIIVGLVSLICIVYSKEVLMLLNKDFYEKIKADGFESEFILLNQIFLLAPTIFALKGVFGMFLNYKKSFKIYSLDGVITNIGSIFGLSVLYIFYGITGAAWGLVIGFVLTTLLFGYDAFKHGFRFQFKTFDGLGETLIKSLFLFIPRLFIISTPRWAEILISSFSNDIGGITTTRMSLNIQGVFYGLMIAIGTVMLPDLTNIINTKGKGKVFWDLINRYINKTLFVAFIAMFLTIIFAPAVLFLIKLLAFVDKDSLLANDTYFMQIIYLIAIGSIAIIPQAISEIMHRYFIAIEDNLIPIVTSVVGNLIALIVTFVLVKIYEYNAAYVVTIAFVINMFATTILMYLYMLKDKKTIEHKI